MSIGEIRLGNFKKIIDQIAHFFVQIKILETVSQSLIKIILTCLFLPILKPLLTKLKWRYFTRDKSIPKFINFFLKSNKHQFNLLNQHGDEWIIHQSRSEVEQMLKPYKKFIKYDISKGITNNSINQQGVKVKMTIRNRG